MDIIEREYQLWTPPMSQNRKLNWKVDSYFSRTQPITHYIAFNAVPGTSMYSFKWLVFNATCFLPILGEIYISKSIKSICQGSEKLVPW